MAVIGVDAIRMLNSDGFRLRTKEELYGMKFGKHAKDIIDYVAVRGSMDRPDTVESLSYHAGLSKKQGSMALDCMVNRKDQVFTKFKDSDILVFHKLYGGRPTEIDYMLGFPPMGRKGWLNEALDELTEAIDELGGAVDGLNAAVYELGESGLANKLFGSPERQPWNYVPLISQNNIPVYENMKLRIIR
jgi:hypothetical protein